jgi:hypothetical protein
MFGKEGIGIDISVFEPDLQQLKVLSYSPYTLT